MVPRNKPIRIVSDFRAGASEPGATAALAKAWQRILGAKVSAAK